MKKKKFSLALRDAATQDLADKTDHKIVALWAKHCVEHVMHYFIEKYPQDLRPQYALETLQAWIDTGVFKMSVIRAASLGSHAAAREIGEDIPARSIARAAGQAVATAHVRTHCMGAAVYALQAIHRATDTEIVATALAKEIAWQYRELFRLSRDLVVRKLI